MILWGFLLLSAFAFTFLFAGLKSGVYGEGAAVERNGGVEYESKLFYTFCCLVLAATLFISLSYSALNLFIPYCENVVLNSTVAGAVTTYSNQITCSLDKYIVLDEVSLLYSVLGYICIILLVIFIIVSIYYTVKNR